MAKDIRSSLIEHEGLRLKPYLCTAGKLTIGVGRNLDDNGISEAEALYMLDSDIADARDGVNAALPWALMLPGCRYDVLVEMCFNMGLAGLLKFVATLGYVKAGEYDKAADAMLSSKWAGQVGKRANVLAARMRTGRWEE